MRKLCPILLLFTLWLTACQVTTVPTPFSTPIVQAAVATLPPPASLASATATAVPPTQTPNIDLQATIEPSPSATASPTITLTPTPTITPSATPIGPCTDRNPSDNLLTIITLTYSLSRHYQPGDLVPLSDYLPVDITLGYPTELRQIAVEPLVQMIDAMHSDGLSPFLISGYRSYAAQAIAWEKWNRLEPARAHQLSAPPGYSEHQLGTTVDFGSPELAEIVGDLEIEFHTYFYQTSEGQWLLQHAHEYGFTLSYSREAFELTGFYYEPWHYRYVGTDLATYLHEQNLSLTAYQVANFPLPCIP